MQAGSCCAEVLDVSRQVHQQDRSATHKLMAVFQKRSQQSLEPVCSFLSRQLLRRRPCPARQLAPRMHVLSEACLLAPVLSAILKSAFGSGDSGTRIRRERGIFTPGMPLSSSFALTGRPYNASSHCSQGLLSKFVSLAKRRPPQNYVYGMYMG